MNTFGNSEGFEEKRKFRGGGGVNDYGILRAWGGNAFWNFRRQGGVKILKPSVVVCGYFLELPMEEIYKKFTFDFSNPQESTTQYLSFEWSHFRILLTDSIVRPTFYYTENSTKESTAQCFSFEWSFFGPDFPAGAVIMCTRWF